MDSSFLHNPDGVGRCCHAATVVGDGAQLFAVWYAYPEEEHKNGRIVFTRGNGKGWEKSRVIEFQIVSSCGNPVLHCAGNGELWLFFVVLRGGYWNKAVTYASRSTDGGRSWSDPNSIQQPAGVMVRHRPLTCANGTLLLPAYEENSMQTFLLSGTSPARSWKIAGAIPGKHIQGDAVPLKKQEWQLYFRPAGDSRFVHRAYSADDGKTWTTPVKTPLPCPLSGIAAARLDDLVVVAHNHTSQHARTPLSISWSADRGMSWQGPWHVDQAPFEVSYPSLFVDEGGTAHLVYTYNRRMIKHVAFTRRDLEH